jgi:hypothetical protein
VQVRPGRDACADVQELPDAFLRDQVAGRAVDELAVLAGHVSHGRDGLHHRLADGAVDREVVLAAQPVVVDAGRVWDVDVDARRSYLN